MKKLFIWLFMPTKPFDDSLSRAYAVRGWVRYPGFILPVFVHVCIKHYFTISTAWDTGLLMVLFIAYHAGLSMLAGYAMKLKEGSHVS